MEGKKEHLQDFWGGQLETFARVLQLGVMQHVYKLVNKLICTVNL